MHEKRLHARNVNMARDNYIATSEGRFQVLLCFGWLFPRDFGPNFVQTFLLSFFFSFLVSFVYLITHFDRLQSSVCIYLEEKEKSSPEFKSHPVGVILVKNT